MARPLFPEPASASEELTVVSDEGEVWRGTAAWPMASRLSRILASVHIGPPAALLASFARQAFELLSKNRKRLSEWLESCPTRQSPTG